MAAIALLGLTACAGRGAVELSQTYAAPPKALEATSVRPAAKPAATCLVRLAEVVDLRTDPRSMGVAYNRDIHSQDAAAWIRSGLQSLAPVPGVRFIDQDQADGSELVLKVELIKAYVMTITTQNAANVVIRIHYSQGPAAEPVYRGAVTRVDWANGDDEIQSALNQALTQLLPKVQSDIRQHCLAVSRLAAARPSPAEPAVPPSQ